MTVILFAVFSPSITRSVCYAGGAHCALKLARHFTRGRLLALLIKERNGKRKD